MELSQILNSLSGSDSLEKTASHNSAEGRNSLNEALSRAMESGHNVKTASARSSSPAEDLTRMAVKLASAEQEALVKEAELYGAAAADGFMSRMQDYEQPFSKQASFGGYSAEDELLVKQAMEMGYQDTMGALEKVASDSYYQGYNDTYNDYGYMDKVASDYSEMEKIASFEKLAAIVKVAEEETTRDGYKIGMKILANMGRGF